MDGNCYSEHSKRHGLSDIMDIHVHVHNGEVKEGKAPRRKSTAKASSSSTSKPKKKGKPMTRKTQLAINRGRKAKGMKPIKFKKKGV